MDVAAFSGDTFDAKAWINKAFQQPEAQQNKEQYASALVTKLQIMITRLNANLEEQCEQVSVGLLRPKVLRDVESLQQEAVLLQGRMADVRNEMDKATTEPAQETMQTIMAMPGVMTHTSTCARTQAEHTCARIETAYLTRICLALVCSRSVLDGLVCFDLVCFVSVLICFVPSFEAGLCSLSW